MEIDAPAPHRMKYDVGIINFIIHQFEQVTSAVHAKPDVFIFQRLQRTVIFIMLKGVQYVLPADVVPKRSIVELYVDFHVPILQEIGQRLNTSWVILRKMPVLVGR
ncbi:MAG: hypothetical protein LBQ94_10200 [Treponema sp.]|jgi:hypothetical protein|nr:hypothetical protein [Treponema sp.]